MAEALLTSAQNPPFAATATFTPAERLDLLGPGSIERVVAEVQPDVSAAVSAELDAASEENAVAPSHELDYVYELIDVMSGAASGDKSVTDALMIATPTEARRLGAFAAAKTIATGISEVRAAQRNTTENRVYERAVELQIDQSAYEPGDRDEVHQKATEVIENADKHDQAVDNVIGEVTAETLRKPLADVAVDALVFLDNNAIGDPNILGQLEVPRGASYPAISEELLAHSPGFITKIVEAVETGSGEAEKTPLAHYQHGMRRTAAYLALVVTKTASGEQSSSTSA